MATVKNTAKRAPRQEPGDNRWMKWTGSVFRPYTDHTEAVETVPTYRRHKGLFAIIANSLYWYKDGVADLDLVPFITDSGGSDLVETTVDAEQAFTLPAGYLLEYVIFNPPTDCDAHIDTDGSIIPGDVMLEQPISSGGTVIQLLKMAWADVDMTVFGLPVGSFIYFVKRKIF